MICCQLCADATNHSEHVKKAVDTGDSESCGEHRENNLRVIDVGEHAWISILLSQHLLDVDSKPQRFNQQYLNKHCLVFRINC